MNTPIFLPKTVYSFKPWASAVGVLGGSFNNVVVLAVLDKATAEAFGDVTAKYQQLLPFMPEGTSRNPDDSTYIRVQSESGETTILATAWIDSSTVVQSSASKAYVVISNVIPQQIPLIKNALINNGFNQIEVTMTNPNG